MQVDRRDACILGQGLSQNPSKFLNDAVIKVMSNNLRQYPTIKFQYVGTEEGVSTVFPKFKACDDLYDPRFRFAIFFLNHFFYSTPFLPLDLGMSRLPPPTLRTSSL